MFSTQAFLYDGKSGELKGQLGEGKTHAGGIYAVSELPTGSLTIRLYTWLRFVIYLFIECVLSPIRWLGVPIASAW